MKIAGLILCACLAAWPAWALAVQKDALLSLLDEIIETAQNTEGAGQTPVFEAQTPAEPNQAPPAAEPNALPIEPQPTPLAVKTEPASTQQPACASAAIDEARQLRQMFMTGHIEPVRTLSAEQQQDNLNRLIDQLNRLEAPRKLVSASPAKKKEQDQPAETFLDEAKDADIDAGQGAQAKNDATDPNTAGIEMLERLLNAESVIDPIRLADALFRQGYEDKAFEYYRQAAEQLQQEPSEALQWALFQMANCSIGKDPVKAKELYEQLLSRFPNSQWNNPARARLATLDWIMKEQVQRYLRTGEHARR